MASKQPVAAVPAATGPAASEETAQPDRAAAERWPLWLLLLLLLFAVLHVGYAVASPPLSGPDERQHLEYVRSLALHGELPEFDGLRNDYTARPEVVYSAVHGPVYYALMAPFYRLLQPFGERALETGLRHVNGLIGVLLIVLSYAGFKRMFRDSLLVAAATTATALHPMTLYLSSLVTNEVLAAVWTAAVFYCLARILGGEDALKWWLLAGAAAAAGLLTKYTTIVAVFAGVFVLFHAWRRGRGAPQALVSRLAGLIVPIVLLAGWWFARNLQDRGELFPLLDEHPVCPNGLSDVLTFPEVFFSAVWKTLVQIFLTYVGPLWLLRPRGAVFYLLGGLWLALFGLPLVGWVRGRARETLPAFSPPERCFLLAGALALAANVVGILNSVLFHQVAMVVFAGRLMLCSLPWTMLLCVVGTARATGDEPKGQVAARIWCTALALQNLWLIPLVGGIHVL